MEAQPTWCTLVASNDSSNWLSQTSSCGSCLRSVLFWYSYQKSPWIWVGGNPFFFQNTNAGPDKTSHCPGVGDHRSGGAAPVRSKCHGTIWETFRRLEYGNTSKYIYIYIEFHFIIIVIWLQYTSYHFMYVSSTPFFFLRRTASTAFRSQVKDFRQTGEGFARRWGSQVEQWSYMDLPPRN